MTDKSKLDAARILAADLWPGLNSFSLNDQYDSFLDMSRPAFRRFIESLLLYDRIVIPTESFLGLRAVVGVMGEDNALDLLDRGCLSILRVDKGLCYIGSGAGLGYWNLSAGKNSKPKPLDDIDEAIDWSFQDFRLKNHGIKTILAKNTVQLELQANAIADETRADIVHSTHLRRQFGLSADNFNRLPGIEPSTLRTYNIMTPLNDQINVVLSLGRANLELLLADEAECRDLATGLPIGHFLKGKIERGNQQQTTKDLIDLREIDDIPDVGELVLKDRGRLQDVLRLRDSRHWKSFRDWFHANCRDDPASTAREYIKLLSTIPGIQSVPARVLRFICTTLLGFLTPAGGVAASAVDSFLIDSWLCRKSRKFFIDQLKQFR